MVAVFSKSWLPSIRVPRLVGIGGGKAGEGGGTKKKKLEILAFEAARTMSRLVSLHRSLSNDEISGLRSGVMRCYAVTHLNSPDQLLLLRLACAEMVDELDRAAAAVTRLAARCSESAGPWPKGFQHVYADIKAGTGTGGLDWRVLGFPAKDVEKRMRRMEGYAEGMGALHEEMEALAEMEASEKRLQRWKSYSGPIPAIPQQQTDSTTSPSTAAAAPPGADMFRKKLAWQRRAVKKMQEEALWGQNVDKATELMARAVVTVFARICTVFGPAVPELPRVHTDRNGRFRLIRDDGSGMVKHHNPHHHHQPQFRVFPDHFSGPLERQGPAYQLPKADMIRSSGPLLFPAPNLFRAQDPAPAADESPFFADPDKKKKNQAAWTARVLEQPASTVGGAGLALRYADVIALAERMLYSPEMVSEDAKSQLYQMLPGELRTTVAARTRRLLRKDAAAARRGVADEMAEAGSWREEARTVLGWLAPMAHDTVRWHTERSYERQKLEAAPKVLVLQTLCWSDRKKTEAAIVDVLVALTFVFRYLQGSDSGAVSDREEYWD